MDTQKEHIEPVAKVAVKHWNAYTCPDCRGIFRAPRDYTGIGVVCPLCDRMLRLPKEGEVQPRAFQEPEIKHEETTPARALYQTRATPPLAAKPEVKATPIAYEAPNVEVPVAKTTERSLEDQWGHAVAVRHTTSRNPNSFFSRYKFFVISFCGLLLILLTAIVVKEFSKTEKPAPTPTVAEVIGESKNDTKPLPPIKLDLRLAEAEAIVRGFMNAETLAEMKKYIYLNKDVERKVNAHHAATPWKRIGFSSINQDNIAISPDRRVITLVATDSNFEESEMSLRTDSKGYLIDWESWVGWNEMSVEEILAVKPKEPVKVRARVSNGKYYNFDFPQDQENQWACFKLVFVKDDRVLHGYVPRAGELHDLLRLQSDEEIRNMLVTIRYAENSTSTNQVLIESVIQEGWVTP